MARDAHAIALNAFAQAHAPLPEFPALPPAAVPLALTSMLLPIAPAPEVLNDAAPVLALCPAVVPMAFSHFLNPDHSIRRWLTAALPLVLASWVTEALAIPVSPAVAPVVKKTRKSSKSTGDKAMDKTPYRRSHKPKDETSVVG